MLILNQPYLHSTSSVKLRSWNVQTPGRVFRALNLRSTRYWNNQAPSPCCGRSHTIDAPSVVRALPTHEPGQSIYPYLTTLAAGCTIAIERTRKPTLTWCIVGPLWFSTYMQALQPFWYRRTAPANQKRDKCGAIKRRIGRSRTAVGGRNVHSIAENMNIENHSYVFSAGLNTLLRLKHKHVFTEGTSYVLEILNF